MPLPMFPGCAEVGFSSASVGALGTAALLSLTMLIPAHVVGTDILFGFCSRSSAVADRFAHATNGLSLRHLVFGGLFGVAIGVVLVDVLPKCPLHFGLWIWLLTIAVASLYINIIRIAH